MPPPLPPQAMLMNKIKDLGSDINSVGATVIRIILIEGNTKSLRLKSNLEKDFAAPSLPKLKVDSGIVLSSNLA
jgi:hypothetical protein